MPFTPQSTLPPSAYLTGDLIIEVDHPEIQALAREFRTHSPTEIDCARTTFNWVRDEIPHSYDARNPRVTLRASEVLEHRTGLCYAKSHLLAALLRANEIPTALCYQRLTHGPTHVLHGLIAVHLNNAWHRQDPRGNRPDITAEFSLTTEQLAFPTNPTQGEIDYPQLHLTPAPTVVTTLQSATDILAIYDTGLPTQLTE